MSSLTAQITEITNEISELQERIETLRIKRQALAKLESTYNETVIIVQETAALMVQAGLDPKTLAQEIRQLIAPRKAKSEPVADTEEYEVIEVETPKPTATPAPTPQPTQAPKQLIVTTPAPTPSPNSYGFTTTSKNYGRVESKKAPTTVETSPTTPEHTKAPTIAQEVALVEPAVSDWSMQELKEFARAHWSQKQIKDKATAINQPLTAKATWVRIVASIKGELAGLNKNKKAA